tara:strand:- start:817 stop:990 length:174 start_codon:yes stop_codon:yes gene_type:complete
LKKSKYSEVLNKTSNIKIKRRLMFEKYNSLTKTTNSFIELLDPEDVYRKGILNNVVM